MPSLKLYALQHLEQMRNTQDEVFLTAMMLQVKSGACLPELRVIVYYDEDLGTAASFSREHLAGEPATSYGWLDPGLIMKAKVPQPLSGERFWPI